jgi:hypothetical protein
MKPDSGADQAAALLLAVLAQRAGITLPDSRASSAASILAESLRDWRLLTDDVMPQVEPWRSLPPRPHPFEEDNAVD